MIEELLLGAITFTYFVAVIVYIIYRDKKIEKQKTQFKKEIK